MKICGFARNAGRCGSASVAFSDVQKKREAFASRFILVDLHSIIANIFPVTETYIFADFPFLRNDKHSFVYNPEINSSAHRQGNPDLSHAPFT